jgi:hypothetical protein
VEGTLALRGDNEGVPVKEAASAGKAMGRALPARRARSASLGILSMVGSDGMEGEGTPNWGWRISAPEIADG